MRDKIIVNSDNQKGGVNANLINFKNMDNKFNNQTIFSITINDIQQEANRLIGRDLAENELGLAVKGINCGLSTDINTVFEAAIDEALNKNC